jgi:hypothetical protein
MKRIVTLGVAALVMAAMILAMAMPAFADSASSDNCIATASSAIIHNGFAVRYQDRQAEIKGLQAGCNHANDK